MRLAAAFAAHELRTQRRSLRFRVLAALYVALGSFPALLIWLRREQSLSAIGSSTYAAETLEILPLLAAVTVFLISLDAITREQEEGAWSTVSLAGTSNAGYLLRRWLALQALLLPLTAVPVAVAAALAVAANGPETLYASAFGVPWLLLVVPVALVFSALAVAVGTIAGGAINAFLLAAFALLFLPTLIDTLLGHFRIRLGPPLAWLGMTHLPRTISRMLGDPTHDTFLSLPFPLAVSELPFDTRAAAGPLLARAAVSMALAATLLALAVRYLRRTRPDVRPWRIRKDHPLRTFLVVLARLRERYTPDPSPSRTDLAALCALLALAAGASALGIGRVRYFEGIGRARFAAEKLAGARAHAGGSDPGPLAGGGAARPGPAGGPDGDGRDEEPGIGVPRTSGLRAESIPPGRRGPGPGGDAEALQGLGPPRGGSHTADPPGRPARAPAPPHRRAGGSPVFSPDLRIPHLPQAVRRPSARAVLPGAPRPLHQLRGAGPLGAPDPPRHLRPLPHPPLPALEAGRRAARAGGLLHPAGGRHDLAHRPAGAAAGRQLRGHDALRTPRGRLPHPPGGARRDGRAVRHAAVPGERYDGGRLPRARPHRRAAPGVPRRQRPQGRGGLARAGRPAADGGARMVREPGLRSRPHRRGLEHALARPERRSPSRRRGTWCCSARGI